jgi:FkbM family methyltransferase
MRDINKLEYAINNICADQNKISLIQIGANDGSDNAQMGMEDPVRNFVKNNYKIFAILIEPQKIEFENLKKTYKGYEDRVQFFNFAIADKNGPIKLYKNIDANGNPGHSSLLLRQDEQNCKFSEESYEIVEGITIYKFMLNKDKIIDALIIDAEGYDIEIIKQFIQEKIYPKIIYFEKPYPRPNNDRLGLIETGDIPLNNILDKLKNLNYNIEILDGNILCTIGKKEIC